MYFDLIWRGSNVSKAPSNAGEATWTEVYITYPEELSFDLSWRRLCSHPILSFLL